MFKNLIRFGGHDLAAGFIVKSENLEEVKNIFKTSIENIKIEKEKKSLKIDAEYSIENIDEDMFETMESISPYGLENHTHYSLIGKWKELPYGSVRLRA